MIDLMIAFALLYTLSIHRLAVFMGMDTNFVEISQTYSALQCSTLILLSVE